MEQALSKLSAFSGLEAATSEAISRAAIRRHYYAGQIHYLGGEPATAVFVPESGWAKATRMSPDGREQALSVRRPVDFFGDVAVFTDTSYRRTVVALENVEVRVIEGVTFLDLVSRYPMLAIVVIRHLGERDRYFIGLVEDLSLRSVEARLAGTLPKNAEMKDGRLIVPRRQWATFDEMAASRSGDDRPFPWGYDVVASQANF